MPRRSIFITSSCLVLAASSITLGAVSTTVTTSSNVLAAALSPSGGLEIDDVEAVHGMPGQVGTFTNFVTPPVTIHDGIVLSSGSVAQLGPIPGATEPDYDPASPPPQVNSPMFPWPQTGGTPEFDTYGFTDGGIENFFGSFDVAAVRVDFTLDEDSPVKFDFIFGSVEYPYWTSQFTDAFLVFLDGTDPSQQITFDSNGNAVQVGSSFAGLETTADQNCAFSNPHGLIHHLTTTTERLDKGPHFLIFEVADVNDQILDSGVFIARLRAELGDPGTEPTEDCLGDLNEDGVVNGADLAAMLGSWGDHDDGDLNGDDITTGADLAVLLGHWGVCPDS